MSNEIEMNLEHTEIHRLFYVDDINWSNDKECRITGDFQNMPKVIDILRQLDLTTAQIYGIFGDNIALEKFLHSLFPNAYNQTESLFNNSNQMPTMWAVFNSMNVVFLLIPNENICLEKEYYFITVMQRFLQDMCQTIIICPSEIFYKNFSHEHSFHGKPHGSRTYKLVKKELVNIEAPQMIKFDDKNILKSLLDEHCQNVLCTNSSQVTYCVRKTFEESNTNIKNKKITQLNELLQIHFDISTADLRTVLNLCDQNQIFLSNKQKIEIEKIITTYVQLYNNEIANIDYEAKSSVQDLIGIPKVLGSLRHDTEKDFRKHLYQLTQNWLINPKYFETTSETHTDFLLGSLNNHLRNIHGSVNIKPQQRIDFINRLKKIDKKNDIRHLQENCIKLILLETQSENQLDVHFDIHPLYYIPQFDNEHHLQHISINASTPIQITLNELNHFMNLSEISESDRLELPRRIEVIACFSTNDSKSEIIVIKRPNINNRKLSDKFGYSIVWHKNGFFRKLSDYTRSEMYMQYAYNQSSQTLIFYHINTGDITRWSLNEFGELKIHPILHQLDTSTKPNGIKSLALTIAQDLLILIDSTFNVYSINISQEDSPITSLLYKMTNNSNYERNFTSDNGELYQTVQTIGEKNPIFFFQAKSSIDIIDQNYCQIYSIKINENNTYLYKMQIFTDFIDTYCILFNEHVNEVYCIQNLISDTRIERQESLNNLDKSTKQYIGNRLLDIIKSGEIQFGTPNSSDETQYYFIVLPEYSSYSDNIKRYFKDLHVSGQLTTGYEKINFNCSNVDIEYLIKIMISRVPLQICTIEMGTLIPLNNGKRDRMDHLSSKSFRIDMKAREISFSYIDYLLNDINENENIKIIGIIGRQSTGKSYLLNKIFQTRFAVAAGRCTDGIWISYAFIENIHFIILDCEGLFSDQRTEDEEIKLISLLTAVCDITILSQDLGFSRFQDRLFTVLSQAVEKISKSEKLFKGILLVAIRDISDINAKESFDAAEKKFLDLQSKGKSGFLEQLFSNTFKVQLLHHFENKNFDYEVKELRRIFFTYINTELNTSYRWENGKTLANRLKILLVQLYTDDFIDSDEIHIEMKIIELIEQMKKAWTRFNIDNDEENIDRNEQIIETLYENKPYLIKLNHAKLHFDENSSDQNFDNICEFILNELYPQNHSTNETKEEINKIRLFINEIIREVMIYRRQKIKELMLEKFQKEFPNETNHIKERKIKFLNTLEQYMLSFKPHICLKKCSICDLKCIKNSEHTQETKTLLEKKKEDLRNVQTSLETLDFENIRERMQKLNEEIILATSNENTLHQKMLLLSNELKYLLDKEKLQTDNNQCNIKINIENEKILNFQQNINNIEQQLKILLPNKENFQNTNQLLNDLNQELLPLLNPIQYNTDQLTTLINLFHKNNEQPTNDLLCFSIEEETNNIIESTNYYQHLTPLFFSMMNKNLNQIQNYSIYIQDNLTYITNKLQNSKENLNNTRNIIKELEQNKIIRENQIQNIKISIEKDTIDYDEIIKQINDINTEKETLLKTINDNNQLNNRINSSIIQKIQYYLKNLQDNQDNLSYTYNYNDYEQMETFKNQEIQKFNYFSNEKTKKESIIDSFKNEIKISNNNIQIKYYQEQINQNEENIQIILEKINLIQTRITAIEIDQLIFKHNNEINQSNQLIENLNILDQKIQSIQNRLLKYLEKINEKKISIQNLEKDDLLELIDQEKNLLEKLNKLYENAQIELTDLEQEKLSLCNNNSLLNKILNEPQYDTNKQNQNLQDRLNQLLQSFEQFNEKKQFIFNTLSSNNIKLNEQDQELININKKLDEKNLEYEKYNEEVKINEELNTTGNELFQLLTNIKTSLMNNIERFNKIFQACKLIHEYTSLLNTLKTTNEELVQLKTEKERLDNQLYDVNSINISVNFTNSIECDKHYKKIIQEYEKANLYNKELKQGLSNISNYSRLIVEIADLEKLAQNNCNCGTDHKCSGICQICTIVDTSKNNLCMFLAGHYGEHKCDAGHNCTKFCQICEIYGFPNNRCHYSYDHTEPEHHQCERVHQCPATCICSDPCAIPLELKQHDIHQCNKTDCWKPCIFSCGNLCATQDHNHDMKTGLVTITIGRETFQMKKHLCNQPHECKGICDASGVCKQEYKTQQRKWTTESGEEFTYDHIEVEEVRGKCGIKIPVGKSSHGDTTNHLCDGQHTCSERCPDCDSFCRNPHGHDGYHRTLHRNKELHIFTSTDPTDQIEIRSNELEETTVRKYKVGESAKPENCSVSCKRRGRSHFHLVECPGDSACWEKILGNKAKHSNDTYYYGQDIPSTKKFDQILCSTYWSQHKWFPPVNDADRKFIDSCNVYCTKHVEKDRNGVIIKDSIKGFCTLDAGHTDNHVFQCQADHHTLEMYQGIDICFVIDTTRSMARYFDKMKTTIKKIITDNQILMKKLGKSTTDFRFGIVDYRDHEPEAAYLYHTCDFTSDTLANTYITNLTTGTGGDIPEAVLDALDASCDLGWRDNADRLLFHILDAPPHGKTYIKSGDKWPDGCPCGKTAQNVLQKMKKKKISYNVLHCSNLLNMMITEFKNHIDVKTLTFDDKITFEDVIAKQVHRQLIDTEITLKKT